MTKPSENLVVEQQDSLLFIKLNRPQKRNALNDPTILELGTVFDTIPEDVKAIVFHSEGKHFSAGLDLSELTERDAVQGLMHSRMWHSVFDKIQFSAIPVVAALTGGVIGGGLELACAAHIRVADPTTFYAMPEGQRGIFVGGGASVRVPKLVGIARVTDMMLTGRVVDAQEGYVQGFSQYIVEDENSSLEKATELAKKIAENTSVTNYALTNVLPRIADASQEQGLMMESLMAAIAQDSAEAKFRLEQFLSKKAKKVGEE